MSVRQKRAIELKPQSKVSAVKAGARAKQLGVGSAVDFRLEGRFEPYTKDEDRLWS